METKRQTVIAISPKRVWDALTDAKQLKKWCCDEAVSNEKEYVLQGSSVFSGSLGGSVTHYIPEQQLSFTWVIEDSLTTVHILLEGEEQSGFPPATFTKLTVEHKDIPNMGIPGSDRMMDHCFFDCIWALWQRQLKLWLERAEIPGKLDMTLPLKPLVEQSIVIDQSSSVVWEYLMDNEKRKKWLDIDMGQELAREEGRLLKHSWIYETFPSTVTWELVPLANHQTLVIVRHEGMPESYGYDHNLGWYDYLVSLSEKSARPLIRQTIWIEAPREVVWRYMGSEEGLRRWWNPETRFESKIGGEIVFGEYGVKLFGRVVELIENKKLAFTWQEDGATDQEKNPLLLTMELEPENGGTRVKLSHSGFDLLPSDMVEKTFRSYQNGWSDAQELPRLKAAVLAEMVNV